MKSRITLKELSKLLNVSVSTVSKALNDSPEISPKTIQRVKELATLHKYRPNPTAVNLKSSKSGTIGVIVPNISNTFFAKVLSGIEAQAQKYGLQVITYISNESWEEEKKITEMLATGFVDGVLLAIAEETQRKKDFAHIENLMDYNIPVVLYDRIDSQMPLDRVGVDDQKIFFNITKYLQSQGLKKIGIATSIHHMGVGKLRITGYKEALSSKEDFFIANSAKPESLREKLLKLLLQDKVDAVLCSDFDSTMMTYRLAFENDIKIPEDLKMVGFINGTLAKFLAPSISYVDQQPEEIGSIAMDLLTKRINQDRDLLPVTRIVETNLIHLESTRVNG
jgi:LacI family transcriptional regulator